MQLEKTETPWLERQISTDYPSINLHSLLFSLIMVLAIFSRLYILGERVMSHDEVNHVVPSFELYQGSGYVHSPITHGPFQFHIVALTYFMLGDTDFTSRLPAAIFSIATVAFAWWGFRRYLGQTGALIASFMMLISPYVLFYGRYTRNEAFVALYALVMLYSILRYLEVGQSRYLYIFTLAVVMHFITKETSFIYAAQALIFLAVVFFSRILRRPWVRPSYFRPFLIALVLAGLLLVGGLGVERFIGTDDVVSPTITAPADPAAEPTETVEAPARARPLPIALLGLGIISALVGVYFLVQGYSREALIKERSFDLLILLGTLVLPHLAAFPVDMLGFDPLNYQWPGFLPTAITVLLLSLLAVGVGLWWRPRLWLGNAALFYAIFIVFYTTFFTNGSGFLTGLVGSLGYWVSQQDVQRGTQPLYYYALVQIPMYEYLAALGTFVAFYLAARYRLWSAALSRPGPEPQTLISTDGSDGQGVDGRVEVYETTQPPPVMALLLFWSITSLLAYSYAGERMPWLTVHIAVPMILCAGWAFGHLVDTTRWRELWRLRGWLVLLVIPVFFFSLAGTFSSLLGTQPPFQGQELVQLQATSSFIFSLLVTLLSGGGLYYLLQEWDTASIARTFGMVALALLAVLTARAAIRSSFINYDEATEFLVYAHAARGPKEILAQVEEISQRTTGGLDIAVAYDDDALYPYWWYFRRYPNKNWYAGNPTRELRNNPIILVSEKNYRKLENIVGEGYYQFDYVRLWWPMQSYYNLTLERIWNAISDPGMRSALFKIWMNADYTQFAQLTGASDLTPTTWQPSNRMRMYIRKDLVAQIWNYGVAPAPQEIPIDPYEDGYVQLAADLIVGAPGNLEGQFQAPRGIAAAADGSIYVADSRNHRIQHLGADGSLIGTWGTFGDSNVGDAPGGSFNEPWGVATGPDGSVYVADTWNHRIQKFSATGEFINLWGYPSGQGEQPQAFWGPRGIAVDNQGRVYVTDTGNKRIVVFDENGGYVTQIGSGGFDPGQFDEPVGIAVDGDGNIYVADTWNQRVQVFTLDPGGVDLLPITSWDITGWYGQSVDNKPYIAVGPQGDVFITDPEGYRVLQFRLDGSFVRTWGDYGTSTDTFGLASGVAVDDQGTVWVTDAGNHRLMRFILPVQ